jgi:transitional endoplasmic reticulum ATPase
MALAPTAPKPKTAPGVTDKEPVKKVDFAYSGDKIVIPEDMSLDDAAEAIQRQITEESVEVSINELIKAFPLDGAVALMHVLKRRYGWTHLVPTPGFWGPTPPRMIGVEIGCNPEDRIQVPWGNCQVPKVSGEITTGYSFDNGMPIFQINGTIKRRHERILSEIAREVREEIKNSSIYRGKAIKINFRNSDGERREFDPSLAPKFIDLSSFGECEPIFSKPIEDAIRLNVLNPIRFTKRCRNKGTSLKKGIMLGGPYGTGKTLTAFQIAKTCVENGWTFLYLEDVRDLDLAIGFAKLYQPCVLFAEDADKAVTGARTVEMDRILNTIDGVESKGEQAIITVLTTNHLEVINRAFLRPGRIDAVINVAPPDVDACTRIVKKYVADGDCKLVGTDEELRDALKCLVGANAAFFRNTVEQAKLSAMESMTDDDGELIITAENIKIAAKGMVPHCKLINPEHGTKSLLDIEEETVDPINMFVDVLTHKFAEGFVSQITNPKTLEKIIVKKMQRDQNKRAANN